jgi:hypothetical protein
MPILLERPKPLHSPTLDTIQMVEDTIRDAKQVISVAELKRRLPRKVNHNTLKAILDYLQKSGKIEFTPDGVVWIFLPKEDIATILRKGRTWT